MDLCGVVNNVTMEIKIIMMDAHNSAKSNQAIYVNNNLVVQNVKSNCKKHVEMVNYKLILAKNVMMVIMLILMVVISSVRLSLVGNVLFLEDIFFRYVH